MTAEEMFDGFDHAGYRDEVVERWGSDAHETGDRWWRGLGDDGRRAFQEEQRRIATATIADAERSGIWPGRIVTRISPARTFCEADAEDQHYLELYPDQKNQFDL